MDNVNFNLLCQSIIIDLANKIPIQSGNPDGDPGVEEQLIDINIIIEGLPADLETSLRDYYNLKQTSEVMSGQVLSYYINNQTNYALVAPYELVGIYLDSNHTTIKHIIHEEYKSINFTTLVKISDAFGITVQEFLADDLFKRENLDVN